MEAELLLMKKELLKPQSTSYEEVLGEYELMTGKDFIMILDLETSGLPNKNGYNYYHYEEIKQYDPSRIVQLSWKIVKNDGSQLVLRDYIIKPCDFVINKESTKIHGINMKYAKEKGTDVTCVLSKLKTDLENVKYIISYNGLFVLNVLQSELYRYNLNNTIEQIQDKINISLSKTIQKQTNQYMNLIAAYKWVFNDKIKMHNSKEDVKNISKIFFGIKNKIKTYTKILF